MARATLKNAVLRFKQELKVLKRDQENKIGRMVRNNMIIEKIKIVALDRATWRKRISVTQKINLD
jgi:hypothetical protein